MNERYTCFSSIDNNRINGIPTVLGPLVTMQRILKCIRSIDMKNEDYFFFRMMYLFVLHFAI